MRHLRYIESRSARVVNICHQSHVYVQQLPDITLVLGGYRFTLKPEECVVCVRLCVCVRPCVCVRMHVCLYMSICLIRVVDTSAVYVSVSQFPSDPSYGGGGDRLLVLSLLFR